MATGSRKTEAAKPTEGEPLKGLTPWREIITPHADVASGRFEQAEFAADLFQVATGNADEEYQVDHAEVAAVFYAQVTSGLLEYVSDDAANYDPANWPLLREALKEMGRADLIGNGKKQLIPAWQPAGTGVARTSTPIRPSGPVQRPIRQSRSRHSGK